ncbi:MAG: AAA family ATPase [Planctomycetota bacterium]
MKALTALCPGPPDWALDWTSLEARFDWVRALASCPQDPVWHAEGDVGTHTRMVLEALVSSPSWRARDARERELLFAACALHDVSKPETTRVEPDGRVTARHHSERGAVRSRRMLWELGAAPEERELVAHLVLHHQRPFFLLERDGAERMASRISWTCGASRLAEVARADILGRACRDAARLLENIGLFEELCHELGCLDAPRVFPSAAHRVAYFADASRAFDSPVAPDATCEVVVLSGPPASGKDHWIRTHGQGWPVVAPDAVRAELGVSPRDEQGLVIQTCRERAREHLRARRSFVWNATNLSRRVRGQVLDLCHRYGAHTRVVAIEASADTVRARNKARSAPVPAAALERMLGRWEAPDATEAHQLERVASD